METERERVDRDKESNIYIGIRLWRHIERERER